MKENYIVINKLLEHVFIYGLDSKNLNITHKALELKRKLEENKKLTEEESTELINLADKIADVKIKYSNNTI